MGWFIVTVIAAILGAIGLGLALVGKIPDDTTGRDTNVRPAGVGILAAVGVLWLLITLVMSYQQVDAGHVQVVKSFGQIEGTITEGSNWIAPWKSTQDQNVQTQREFYSNLEAFSKESQDVTIDATLNYSVDPNAVEKLYRDIGSGWFDKLVSPRVQQITKNETVKYANTDIAPSREQIRTNVRDRLQEELSPYSIEVVDFLLENIDFDPAFKTAIRNKQIATQKALEEQQKVRQAEFVAQQKVATARGEATANRLKRRGLSDLLLRSKALDVQQAYVDNLSDDVSVIVVPSNSGNIFDVSGLLKQGG